MIISTLKLRYSAYEDVFFNRVRLIDKSFDRKATHDDEKFPNIQYKFNHKILLQKKKSCIFFTYHRMMMMMLNYSQNYNEIGKFKPNWVYGQPNRKRREKQSKKKIGKLFFQQNFLRDFLLFFLRLHYTFILLISYQTMCVCLCVLCVGGG